MCTHVWAYVCESICGHVYEHVCMGVSVSVCVLGMCLGVCVCVWDVCGNICWGCMHMCVGVWQSEGMKGVIIHVCKSSPGAKVRVIARIYAKLRRDYA